jgi:hypothetical protein
VTDGLQTPGSSDGQAAARSGVVTSSSSTAQRLEALRRANELEQAFLRILRTREPGYVWRVLTPDELDTLVDGGTFASAGSGGNDRAVEDGAK